MKKWILFHLIFLASTSFSQTHEIYVCDAGNFANPPWQILKFDQNGENPEVFIDNNLAWPQDILFMDNQNVVLISNLNNGVISKYNIVTGTYIEDFTTGIPGPTRMKIGPDNLLYILQWQGNGLVKRYQLDGTFVDDFTDTAVPQSIGLDWDTDGNLYVSSFTGDLVRKFDSVGNDQGIFINSNLLGPTNIWFDDNGDLLVVDYNGTAVKRFDSSGNYLNDFISGLGNAEGIGFIPHTNLPDDNILIGNGATSSVKMFNSNGDYIEDIIASGAGNLLTPNAVVVREVPTSISELEKAHTNFIFPTLGIEFFVLPDLVNYIEMLEVYDLSGKLVDQIKVSETSTWRADQYANGIYIVRSQFKDGTLSSMNITVKH